MAKSRKRWMYVPPKPAKVAIPEALKSEISVKAQELVDLVLKPRGIQPPLENCQHNYRIDFYTKFYHSYFYFYETYACPSPNALSPTFDIGFARMQYVGDRLFILSYMRHTGQWLELYFNVSLEECLQAITDDPHFFL